MEFGYKLKSRVVSSRASSLTLLLLCGLSALSANENEASNSELSFGGPEVLKLDWTTRSMKAADINGDGFNDFALINNDRAKIDIFYQRGEGAALLSEKKKLRRNRWDPVLEDARFEGESVTVGYPLFDLAVGDLNGDGRADLAYTSREVPLTIRYQGESGSWSKTQEFDSFDSLGWVKTVEIKDLNNDGKNELVVVSYDAVRIFSQTEDSDISEPELYYLTGENPFNLIVTDVSQDGLLDLLYITSNGEQSLALRQQAVDGTFGPEYRFTLKRPIRSLNVFDGTQEMPLFCAVDARAGSLEFFKFNKSEESSDVDEAELAIYPILNESKGAPAFGIADLSGEDTFDMLVANPEAAELIYFPSDNGEFAPSRVFPSFSGVSSIASGRFHEAKGDSVVLISKEEKVLGLSRLDQSGRIAFPKQFSIGEGDPIVCSAHDFDGDGYFELVVILERKGARELIVARPSSRGDLDSDWETLASIDLKDVRRSPSAISELDIFGADREGLVVFVPREAPVFISVDTGGEELSVSEFGKESSIRDSLLKGATKAQLSVFDVDDDGQNELIVGRTGYARALKVIEDTLEMVDQFNALRSDDEVSAVIPVRSKDDTLSEIIFYVGSTGEFQHLMRGEDNVFRYEKSRDIGSLDVQNWFFMPKEKGADKLILASADSLWAIDPNRSTWTRSVVGGYETDLEDVNFNYVNGGLFEANDELGLIAIDGNSHVAEILSMTEDSWESSSYWEIFEQNMHYQGRTGSNTEPREVVVSDFTGDGKLDFAFLIHDRILFYPQQ